MAEILAQQTAELAAQNLWQAVESAGRTNALMHRVVSEVVVIDEEKPEVHDDSHKPSSSRYMPPSRYLPAGTRHLDFEFRPEDNLRAEALRADYEFPPLTSIFFKPDPAKLLEMIMEMRAPAESSLDREADRVRGRYLDGALGAFGAETEIDFPGLPEKYPAPLAPGEYTAHKSFAFGWTAAAESSSQTEATTPAAGEEPTTLPDENQQERNQ